MTKPLSDPAWTDELAALWDTARANLQIANTGVAAAKSVLGKLGADAPAERREEAQNAVNDAEAAVKQAKEAIAELAKGPKPPKTPRKPVLKPQPATTTAATRQAVASVASPRQAESADELVDATAVHGVRWNGRTFAPGEDLLQLPRAIFDALQADGAVR